MRLKRHPAYLAMMHDLEKFHHPLMVAIDPASKQGDKTAIALRQGNEIKAIWIDEENQVEEYIMTTKIKKPKPETKAQLLERINKISNESINNRDEAYGLRDKVYRLEKEVKETNEYNAKHIRSNNELKSRLSMIETQLRYAEQALKNDEALKVTGGSFKQIGIAIGHIVAALHPHYFEKDMPMMATDATNGRRF